MNVVMILLTLVLAVAGYVYTGPFVIALLAAIMLLLLIHMDQKQDKTAQELREIKELLNQMPVCPCVTAGSEPVIEPEDEADVDQRSAYYKQVEREINSMLTIHK